MDSGPDGTDDGVPTAPPAAHSPHGVFLGCPQCDGPMRPEHAHYRCRRCGWRDSCCD